MKKMHYWKLPDNLVRMMNKTVSMHGKCGKYLFQNSHGGRQVKLYEPEKYKNHINTPLRKRTREIWKIAYANPEPTLHAKIRELFRTYPYYLLKTEPINLKLKNFYFERDIFSGTPFRIFKMIGELPDPGSDELYTEVNYNQDKKVEFRYSGLESERFYASIGNNELYSNILSFYWE